MLGYESNDTVAAFLEAQSNRVSLLGETIQAEIS